jgi:pyruvate formate lyase activating enzyme
MKIKGLEKVSLIDYPGKVACTIFLFGCNFKCGFCHNPELVLQEKTEDILQKEILEFMNKRQGQLDGVCITGGEPLLTLEKDFLKKIKELGYSIKIDTNGSYPEKLKEFIEEGLVDFVAMDIKSKKEDYLEVVGTLVDLKKIEESMKIISKLENYEFRTTIVSEIHTEENIKAMCEWIERVIDKKGKIFYLQGFKNNGKFIDSKFNLVKDTEEEFLKNLKKVAENYFCEVRIRI